MVAFLTKIKDHIGIICIGFGLFAALVVLISWLYGYWSNGLYGTKFQIDSCWQGISACGMGLVGLMKWMVDSTKNSPQGQFPFFPPKPPMRREQNNENCDITRNQTTSQGGV